jgi:hypothetical protein
MVLIEGSEIIFIWDDVASEKRKPRLTPRFSRSRCVAGLKIQRSSEKTQAQNSNKIKKVAVVKKLSSQGDGTPGNRCGV